MATPFREMLNLDRRIHEPSRLAILTALSACDTADFAHLHRLTGLSAGNLSQHLAKLEAAEFVVIEKSFVRKRPRTEVRLTGDGRRALDEYWRRLDQMRQFAAQSSLQAGTTEE